jgi:transposase
MPRAHPPEFRQRAVELARLRERPVAQIAESLGISDSCLRNWMSQADVDEGRREGLSSRERDELVELRREARTLKLENEILKRAAAYFARENVLPNDVHLHRSSLLGPPGGGVLPGDEGVDLRVLRVARTAMQRPRL